MADNLLTLFDKFYPPVNTKVCLIITMRSSTNTSDFLRPSLNTRLITTAQESVKLTLFHS